MPLSIPFRLITPPKGIRPATHMFGFCMSSRPRSMDDCSISNRAQREIAPGGSTQQEIGAKPHAHSGRAALMPSAGPQPRTIDGALPERRPPDRGDDCNPGADVERWGRVGRPSLEPRTERGHPGAPCPGGCHGSQSPGIRGPPAMNGPRSRPARGAACNAAPQMRDHPVVGRISVA